MAHDVARSGKSCRISDLNALSFHADRHLHKQRQHEYCLSVLCQKKHPRPRMVHLQMENVVAYRWSQYTNAKLVWVNVIIVVAKHLTDSNLLREDRGRCGGCIHQILLRYLHMSRHICSEYFVRRKYIGS